jgi:hypothetical protein
MDKNIKYILVVMVFLFISGVFYGLTKGNGVVVEKEYFVIGTNAILYDSPGKGAKTLLVLSEFEKAILLKNKMVTKRWSVSVNGTNGWINDMNVSVTPAGWKKFDKTSDITILYPKEYNYQFRTNGYVKNDYMELLLYNDESDVVIYHSFKKDFVQHSSEGIKINYYGVEVYYYFGGGGPEDDYVGYEFIIVDKRKKGYYVIDVNTGKPDPTPEEELIAKKILFSVRVK